MTEQKQQARNLYFQTDMTQAQIAELLNINRKTLYLWAKEGAWQHAKQAARHMPSILISQLYAQMGALNEKIANREEQPFATREEAEVMRKLVLTICQLQKRLAGPERVEEMTLLMDQVMKEDYPMALKMAPQIDKHIHNMLPKDYVTEVRERYLRDQQEDEAFEKQFAVSSEQSSVCSSQSAIGSFQSVEDNTSSPLERLGEVPLQSTTDNTTSHQCHPERQSKGDTDTPGKSLNPINPGSDRGANGASMGNDENTETQHTSHFQPIHSSTEQETTEWETNNITPPLEGPGEVAPIEVSLFYNHLDKKYNISQDPNISYHRGIYRIQPGSPLWGLRKSLF